MAVTKVFQAVVPDCIWVSERSLWFSGVRIRSRTTVVRLAGDALWLHSPCAPSDEVCRALDALGDVRWLVVPNRFHHLQVPATAARYPKAIVVGQKSAESRNPQLRVKMGTDHPTYVGSTPELVSIDLEGVPFLDETVFFHVPSGSLIGADLLMTACARDHWTWRAAARLCGRYGKLRTPPDVRWHTRANPEVAASIARLRALPLQRILVSHADPITERPIEQLVAGWNFAIPDDQRQP